MSSGDALNVSGLLRPGLLEDAGILLAAADGDGGFAAEVEGACSFLGARVRTFAALGRDGAARGEEEMAAEAEAAFAAMGGGGLLVVDAAGLFASGGAQESPHEPMRSCLQASWNATRAFAGALLAREAAGRIVYLAPAGTAAVAALAGLENLARTLSIEWARHAITTVAIAPGAGTEGGEVAALVAYLASPAGAYFSGCLLDLRGPRSR